MGILCDILSVTRHGDTAAALVEFALSEHVLFLLLQNDAIVEDMLLLQLVREMT